MLQKQPLKLNTTGGIDNKHDEVLVLPSKLALLENALIGEGGTVESRLGFVSGTQASQANNRLAKFRKTLIIERADGLYAKNGQRIDPFPGSTGYQDFARCDAVATPILGSAELSNPSSVDVAKGLTTSCWISVTLNSGGYAGIAGVILLDSDGSEQAQFLLTDILGATQYFSPRVLPSSTAGEFHLYYVSVTAGPTYQLAHRTISAAGALGSETNVGAAMHSTMVFDVAPDVLVNSTSKFTVALKRATGDIELRAVSSADGVTASASGTVTPSIGVETLCAVTTYDGTKRHCAFFSQSNNILYACGMTAAGTMITQKTMLTLGGGSRIGRMSATDEAGATLETLAIALDVNSAAWGSSAATDPDTAGVYVLTAAKDLLSAAPLKVIARGVLLSSRIRPHIDGRKTRTVFGATRHVTGDSTTFVLDPTAAIAGGASSGTAPLILARLAIGETSLTGAATWTAQLRVPDTGTAPTFSAKSTFSFPMMRYISALQTQRSANVTPIALCRVDCDTASQAPGYVELQNGTLLYGACPYWYDGRTATEQGFNFRPILSGAAHAGAAGTVSAGTYQFYATFGWEDALGNWHESAPSDLLTVTGVLANETITFTASAMNLTWKRNVKLVVYRTEANGSVFYRDQAANSVPGFATIAVSSGGSDAGLLGGSLVPISGDVLENEPLPAMRHAVVWDNRLWMAGCGDGFDIAFSQPLAEGFGVEYNSEFRRRSNPAFGRAVAVAEYGQRLAVFGEDDIGVVFGSGPSRTGEQDNYTEIQPFETALGAVWEYPRTTAATPEGIWFQTDRGMRLLLASGSIATSDDKIELGSEIDSLLGTPALAIHCGSRRELWVWDLDNSYIYVWAYEWKQWSRLRPAGEADGGWMDALETGGIVYTGDDSGYLITYGTSVYTDDGNSVTSTLETPWLQLAGVQGFQRVYDLMVLGKDLDASANVAFTLTPAYDFGAFGSPEVSAVAVAPTNSFIQWTHPFARQKCEALKLRLAWAVSTSRFRLTNLSLMVGLKGGRYKVPSSQRI